MDTSACDDAFYEAFLICGRNHVETLQNQAFEAAKGKPVQMVDPDDNARFSMLEKMVEVLYGWDDLSPDSILDIIKNPDFFEVVSIDLDELIARVGLDHDPGGAEQAEFWALAARNHDDFYRDNLPWFEEQMKVICDLVGSYEPEVDVSDDPDWDLTALRGLIEEHLGPAAFGGEEGDMGQARHAIQRDALQSPFQETFRLAALGGAGAKQNYVMRYGVDLETYLDNLMFENLCEALWEWKTDFATFSMEEFYDDLNCQMYEEAACDVDPEDWEEICQLFNLGEAKVREYMTTERFERNLGRYAWELAVVAGYAREVPQIVGLA